MAPAACLFKTFKTKHMSNLTDTGSFEYKNSIEYSQGNEAGQIQFVLVCKNLPLGTVVGFYCEAVGPNPPISLPPTKVTSTPTFVTGMLTSVPANFEGKINYYADFRQMPPADASIQMQANIPVIVASSSDSPLPQYA